MLPSICGGVRRPSCTGMVRSFRPRISKSLLIPAGFAHGLQTLEDDCELLYFHSAAYAADAEGGIHPLRPEDRHYVAVADCVRCRRAIAVIRRLTADFKGLAL